MNTTNKIKLAIIIPCYNEELVIESTINSLCKVLDEIIQKGGISSDSYLYIIDDGSKDKSWEIIRTQHKKFGSRVQACRFARNYGNQKALIAGLSNVKKIGCDCVISIDADLQQDENTIEEFINKYKNGADIVSGIRNDRKTDSLFKKTTAWNPQIPSRC